MEAKDQTSMWIAGVSLTTLMLVIASSVLA
jgi:hypothetical protein